MEEAQNRYFTPYVRVNLRQEAELAGIIEALCMVLKYKPAIGGKSECSNCLRF